MDENELIEREQENPLCYPPEVEDQGACLGYFLAAVLAILAFWGLLELIHWWWAT